MRFITDYNPDWPNRFERIAAHLKRYLPDGSTLHHVGSTSVLGMPAKDIIDLNIEYGVGNLRMVVDGLNAAGYRHEGDLGIPHREAFSPILGATSESLPAHHLYACEQDAQVLRKHLAFRDYLLVHPQRVKWLADQKTLVDAAANSRAEYIEKKSRYYDVINQEALNWLKENAS